MMDGYKSKIGKETCQMVSRTFFQLIYNFFLKVKSAVAQNWPNLEKRPPVLQFSLKHSEFIFGERSDKSNPFCYVIIPFGSIFFWLGCDT